MGASWLRRDPSESAVLGAQVCLAFSNFRGAEAGGIEDADAAALLEKVIAKR